MIISKKLLEQENYHINLRNYNGYINETNTYYPWELDTVVKKIRSQNKQNDNWSTELVLPKFEVYNDILPDKTKKLFIDMQWNLNIWE